MPPAAKLNVASTKPVMLTDVMAQTKSTGQLGPKDRLCKLLILGKCRSTTEVFFVLPSVLPVMSAQEMAVLAICPDLPCFIPKGLTISQTILLPKHDATESLVMSTKIISKSKIS